MPKNFKKNNNNNNNNNNIINDNDNVKDDYNNSNNNSWCKTNFWAFLDASTHLYMRVCPSVGPLRSFF